MDKLNFIDSLDEEQSENAVKVARMAREAGVDPNLAVAIAFKESSLRTNAPRGESGEIGMMQVMPSTGKGIGYDEKKLSIPNQNIKAGIEYLKMGLQATENDPQLAAIFYNGGPGAVDALKSGKEPDPRVFNYVRSLNSYGTFGAGEASSPETEGGDMVPGAAPPTKPPEPDTSGASRAQQFLFGGAGAGAGALVSTGKGFMDASTGMAAKKAAADETARIGVQRAEADRIAAQRSAAPGGAPSTAAAATPTASRVASTPAIQPSAQSAANPLLATENQATRILQGTTGDEGTTGRSRMGFLEDTSQQASQRKEMDRVMSQLKQAGVAPDEARAFFAKQPGMTSTPSGVRYPRSVPAPTLGPRTYGPPSIQAQAAQSGALPIKETAPYQIGGGKPPPIPKAPKGPSGLDAVTDMFKTMMRPLKPVVDAAKIAGKYAFPPLAGLGAGLELADVAHEYDKKPTQRDYTKMGLQTATGIGGVMSMFPPTQPLGIPLATVSGLAQVYRNDPEIINRTLQKLQERAGDMPYSDPMTGYTAP